MYPLWLLLNRQALPPGGRYEHPDITERACKPRCKPSILYRHATLIMEKPSIAGGILVVSVIYNSNPHQWLDH